MSAISVDLKLKAQIQMPRVLEKAGCLEFAAHLPFAKELKPFALSSIELFSDGCVKMCSLRNWR